MPGDEFEEVLRFWFPEHLRDDHAVMVSQFGWWFGGGADSEIIERFLRLLERAARGELDHWSHEPGVEARQLRVAALDPTGYLTKVREWMRVKYVRCAASIERSVSGSAR